MKLSGRITGADSTERTIIIHCDGPISGVTMGAPAEITIENEKAPKPQHGNSQRELIVDESR